MHTFCSFPLLDIGGVSMDSSSLLTISTDSDLDGVPMEASLLDDDSFRLSSVDKWI